MLHYNNSNRTTATDIGMRCKTFMLHNKIIFGCKLNVKFDKDFVCVFELIIVATYSTLYSRNTQTAAALLTKC